MARNQVKYIKINESYYRKLLRDSQRLVVLKELVKRMHNITKRVESPLKVEKNTNNINDIKTYT